MNTERLGAEIPQDAESVEQTQKPLRLPMPLAKDLVTRSDLIDYAAQNVTLEGLWLEFGVYKGKSIRKIAGHTRADIYGFDSFEGLPEDWVLSYCRGDFSLQGRMPADLPANVKLLKGRFCETLPAFLEIHAQPVAFLHVDCDLYSSTKTVLTCLRNRLTAGSIILFDEFHNFPGWRQHEYRAFMEFIADTRYAFEYIGWASGYNSVAARITGGPNASEHQGST